MFILSHLFNNIQVDPPGCTDIDDALHCRALGNDTFEVGVHIADVSHFVRPGKPIDAEVCVSVISCYLLMFRHAFVVQLCIYVIDVLICYQFYLVVIFVHYVAVKNGRFI